VGRGACLCWDPFFACSGRGPRGYIRGEVCGAVPDPLRPPSKHSAPTVLCRARRGVPGHASCVLAVPVFSSGVLTRDYRAHGTVAPRAGGGRAVLPHNFQRHGSPWADNAIHNLHADAARFNGPFLRALDGLVRAHPEIFLRELSSIFRRLAVLPDWDPHWPTSTSFLDEILHLVGFSVKKVEHLASERCEALLMAHCRLDRHIPDRCIVVVDETHIHGAEMVRPKGWSLVGKPLEALAPDPRTRQRYSSILAISHNCGVLELSVNEVPPAQSGDDWVAFCTTLACRMNGYVSGALWENQPPECVLLYDTASVHNAVADEILTMSGVLLLHLPPYCPNLLAIEPTLADYKRAVLDLMYHHPEMPDRLSHVLAFASIPLSTIQGHYREARREVWRHLPELTGPGMALDGVLPPLPVEHHAPLP